MWRWIVRGLSEKSARLVKIITIGPSETSVLHFIINANARHCDVDGANPSFIYLFRLLPSPPSPPSRFFFFFSAVI